MSKTSILEPDLRILAIEVSQSASFLSNHHLFIFYFCIKDKEVSMPVCGSNEISFLFKDYILKVIVIGDV